MLPWLIGAMGVKGLLDSQRQKKQQLASSKADAANIQFSPWSGINVSHLAGKEYNSQDPLSGIMTGGLAGASAGMNIENALADKGLAQSKANYYASLMPSKKKNVLAAEEDLLEGQAALHPYNNVGLV